MRRQSKAVVFLSVSALFAATLRAVEPAQGSTTAAAQGAKAVPVPAAPPINLPLVKPWKGDLDGMVQRRRIRALVVPTRTQYWIDRGQQIGAEYELLKAFEEQINRDHPTGTKHIKIQVVFVPTTREDLIPALNEGRGDVAAAVLTVTPERQEKADFGTPFFRNVAEIVVTGPGAPVLASLADLAGQELFLRRSSSYWTHLEALNRDFAAQGRAAMRLRAAPEELQDDDILEMVNAGLVKITVIDRYAGVLWAKVFPSLKPREDLPIHTGGDIAWMIRKQSPLLKAAIDKFAAANGAGSAFGNTIVKKYTGSTRFVKDATSSEEIAKFQRSIELFHRYGDRYKLDELLMAAQGYQESRLDQNAKSAVGAIGVMQVMPATGAELDVGNIAELEPNIHAGVKYIRKLIDTYFADEPMTAVDKALFAFASYNAGPGRIRSLRKEAAKRGMDPNRWFNNVELVAAEKIGPETVTYVSNIYKYYIAYKLVAEQEAEKKKALESVQGVHP